MPKFIKNAMNQIIFPMVDKTNFADIESTITASDFNSAATKKFFGVNHGVSDAFTSGSISKAATLVHSGIFQQTLKAAECNYDYIVYRFSHASCADQILIFQTEELDLSDVLSDLKSNLANRSQLSDIASDLRSYLAGMSGMLSDVDSQLNLNASLASDAHSAAAQANSRILVVQSRVSDIESALDSQFVWNSAFLSDMNSDLASKIGAITVTLSASDISDIASAVTAAGLSISASDMSDIASRVGVVLASNLSDIYSAAQQTNSRVLVVQSMASDLTSRVPNAISTDSQLASSVWTYATRTVSLDASDMSDIRSAVAGVTASIGASDISDIASRVYAVLVSDLSDIYSAAAQGNSRALVIQSMVSDVDSQLLLNASMISDIDSALTSQYTAGHPLTASDLSDLRSAITAGFTISASDMSDIASRVGVVVASNLSDILSAAQQTNSRVLVVQSLVSDVDSQLNLNASAISDIESALDSQFAWTSAAISDMNSDLGSKIGNVSVALTDSDISDIASAVAAAVTTVSPSDISDIASAVYAILASNMSDILSAAQQTNSRTLVIQSLVSDVDSQMNLDKSTFSDIQSYLVAMYAGLLTQDMAILSMASDIQSALDSQFAIGQGLNASTMSDIRSAITAGGISDSGISDIASAVLAILASDLSDIQSNVTRANSRLLVNQSMISDIESQLDLNASVISDIQSALDSQFAVTSNLLSDMDSDLAVMSGVLSDVYSNLAGGVTVGASSLSDLYSMMWDTTTTEPTSVPAATVGRGRKLDYLYAQGRNKRVTTSTADSLRNDADGADIGSAAVSYDTGTSTFTRGKWGN